MIGQQQPPPSHLVPNMLGYARDETHRGRKTETKTKVKKMLGGRTIKKPNRKGRKGNKKLKHKKGE
jgi:hypothetical protein